MFFIGKEGLGKHFEHCYLPFYPTIILSVLPTTTNQQSLYLHSLHKLSVRLTYLNFDLTSGLGWHLQALFVLTSLHKDFLFDLTNHLLEE